MPAEQLSFLDGVVIPGRSEHGNVLIEELERWLEKDAPGPRWAEGYWILRKKGIPSRDAALATWLSLGTDDRGEFDTREKFAEGVMGVSRSTTYDWETRRPQIRQWAEFLQVLRLRGARLAGVDERTYQAAISAKGSAADRKLYYQRAGVWEERVGVRPVDEEAGPNEYVNVTDAEREAIRQALIGEAEGGGEAG